MRSEHPENASAADHVAAAAVNILRAAENREPVGTLSTATTVVRCISIDPPCECSCRQHCAVCTAIPGGDAA